MCRSDPCTRSDVFPCCPLSARVCRSSSPARAPWRSEQLQQQQQQLQVFPLLVLLLFWSCLTAPQQQLRAARRGLGFHPQLSKAVRSLLLAGAAGSAGLLHSLLESRCVWAWRCSNGSIPCSSCASHGTVGRRGLAAAALWLRQLCAAGVFAGSAQTHPDSLCCSGCKARFSTCIQYSVSRFLLV